MPRPNAWTQEEIDFLVDNYDKMSNTQLGDILKGRSQRSICQKYSHLMGANRKKRKYHYNGVKKTVELNTCPNCESKRINPVDGDGYFCVTCLTEFDKYGKRRAYC